ncbi:alpha/beta hydrolase [Chloroflexus sp.]|uniref:alpha/beta fold hydrolase n=1 Tax=Chloroflexus sp. TaxID=1904827 RepID=UPI002ACDE743|nr:alpha/beta hydrolase [Chloroflexus sp.]
MSVLAQPIPIERPPARPIDAPPTAKYIEYANEVATRLSGKLSARERRRLEGERALLARARFIELNGVVHHYQDVGPLDGEPLLLIHGWDCSSFWWHHVIDPLAQAGYRVVSYDLKGHGFSDSDPRQDYTVAGFSADVQALSRALNLGPAHVAAFSLGAFIGLRVAAHQPELVRSLIFFNFSLLPYNQFASQFVPRLLDTVFNGVLRPIERRNLWWLPFIYARLVMAQNTPSVGDIRLGTLGLRYCDPAAVRVSATELSRPEILAAVAEQAKTIQQPLLLVAGANDPIMRPSDGRKLVALAPNGSFLEVPKCGHLILFELPEHVIQIMRLFLKGVR